MYPSNPCNMDVNPMLKIKRVLLTALLLSSLTSIASAQLSVSFDRRWPDDNNIRIIEVQKTRTARAAPVRSFLRATWRLLEAS